MSIKDRGTKKWTSFFIPQHVEMIRNMIDEDERMRKPELDDQEKEELDLALHYAIHHDREVELEMIGTYRIETITGRIRSIDMLERKIRFENGRSVPMDDIRNVRVL